MSEELLVLSVLIIVNIILFSVMKRVVHSNGYNFYIDSIMELPGTIIHELSHLIMSVLLLSRVTGFSLIPKVEGNSVTYGYVEQIPKFEINNFFIGMAPLFLNLPLLLGIIYILGIDMNFSIMNMNEINIKNVGIIYLSSVILASSIVSVQDIKVAIGGLFSISGVVFFSIISYIQYKIDIYNKMIEEISKYSIDGVMVTLTNMMINTLILLIVMIVLIYLLKKFSR